MLGGNVAGKLGARNQAAAADGDKSQPAVTGLALQGADGDAKLGGGFGEEEEGHGWSDYHLAAAHFFLAFAAAGSALGVRSLVTSARIFLASIFSRPA